MQRHPEKDTGRCFKRQVCPCECAWHFDVQSRYIGAVSGLLGDLKEEALLMMTDHMVNDRDLTDEIYGKYSRELKDSELVDLISLVSQ